MLSTSRARARTIRPRSAHAWGRAEGKVPRRSAIFARAFAPAALVLAALGLTAPARAEDASPAGRVPTEVGLVVRWQGPEDCLRGQAVQAKVLRLLGGSKRVLGERFDV